MSDGICEQPIYVVPVTDEPEISAVRPSLEPGAHSILNWTMKERVLYQRRYKAPAAHPPSRDVFERLEKEFHVELADNGLTAVSPIDVQSATTDRDDWSITLSAYCVAGPSRELFGF